MGIFIAVTLQFTPVQPLLLTLSFSNTPPRDYTMLKSPPEEQIKQAAKRRRDNNGVSIPSPEVMMLQIP